MHRRLGWLYESYRRLCKSRGARKTAELFAALTARQWRAASRHVRTTVVDMSFWAHGALSLCFWVDLARRHPLACQPVHPRPPRPPTRGVYLITLTYPYTRPTACASRLIQQSLASLYPLASANLLL